MKKISEVNLYDMVKNDYENLTVEQETLLALKGAINKVKTANNDNEKAIYSAFIANCYNELKALGWEW